MSTTGYIRAIKEYIVKSNAYFQRSFFLFRCAYTQDSGIFFSSSPTILSHHPKSSPSNANFFKHYCRVLDQTSSTIIHNSIMSNINRQVLPNDVLINNIILLLVGAANFMPYNNNNVVICIENNKNPIWIFVLNVFMYIMIWNKFVPNSFSRKKYQKKKKNTRKSITFTALYY